MKKLIFLSILFISVISVNAQKKQKKSVRSTLITLPTYTTRMLSDSLRKTTATITALKKQTDSLKTIISSAGLYLSSKDFQIDSVTKILSLKPKNDTIIIRRNTAQRPANSAYNSYTIGTQKLSKEQIDIQDLKWQVNYLFHVVDSMQVIIDEKERKEDYN